MPFQPHIIAENEHARPRDRATHASSAQSTGGADVALILAATALAGVLLAVLDLPRRSGLSDEILPALVAFALGCLWLTFRNQLRLRATLRTCEALRGDALALAHRDPLTGLQNRRALSDFFAAAAASEPAQTETTLLLCDLDRFKQVNDIHGHRAGDFVLREVAARLHEIANNFDDIALVRLGGDEFACAVRHAPGPEVAERLVRRLADAIDAPIAVGPVMVELSASIGTARMLPGDTLDALLARADAAMYEVKNVARPDDADGGIDFAPEGAAPTRRLLERRLGNAEDGRPIYVAILGIDRWRSIRGTIGYALAGALLRELAGRIEERLDGIVVQHLSTDALAIGFRAADPTEAERTLAAIRVVSEGEATIGAQSVDICVVIGYAGPGRLDGVRELIEQAQIAFDQAGETHRRQALFCPDDYGDPLDRLALMRDLRTGLGTGQFSLHYQPKLRVATGTVDSVEALIRWQHPERGAVSPGEFVRIAEETGDIRAMTDWVLDRAVREQASMAAAGHDLFVYVNISARLVGDSEFTEHLLAAVERSGGRIGLEITETAVIDDPRNGLANLNRLAEAGVKLAIDDYGAGMSSLVYLKQLPAHELKIDRLFLEGLSSSHRDPLIVRSTIDLAHGLGLEVTAEGVETVSSLALLQVMGCDMIQGYIVARPMPFLELMRYCASSSASEARQALRNRPDAHFLRHAEFWGAKPNVA
jgi:diguanylate cyclase (GGDEF)-like protein